MKHLTKANFKQLKETGNTKTTINVGTEFLMDVSISVDGTKYLIKGKLIKRNPKSPTGVNGQITVRNKDTIDIVIDMLGSRLVGNTVTTGSESKTSRNNKKALKDFTRRVLESTEIRDPVLWGVRKTGKYLGDRTIDDGIKYFADTIGKMYAKYGTYDVTESEQREYKNELIKKIFNSQNKNNNNPPTMDSIAEGVNRRWKYAEEVRRLLLIYATDKGPWPETPLRIDPSSKVATPELAKVFPYKKYVQAVTILVRACEEYIPEAFSGAGLVLNGARVGESAALKMGEFQFKEGIGGRYYIHNQVDSKGNITDILKNDYSYRYIFLCAAMIKLYELKREHLRAIGISEDKISEAYFGCSLSDPYNPIKKQRVSEFLKELLVFVGCDKDDIDNIEAQVTGNIGSDSDHDVSAHLFRRWIASMLANGGIVAYRVDAELGHENPANRGKDYAGWDKAEQMIKMKDRGIYLGKLAATHNPAYHPYTLGGGVVVDDGNRRIQHIIGESGMVEMDIETMESDDETIIVLKGDIDVIPEVHALVDTEKDRMNRIVLSELPDKKTIDAWIDEANQMNIDGFLEKYRRRDANS